jgi:hypothetical protein
LLFGFTLAGYLAFQALHNMPSALAPRRTGKRSVTMAVFFLHGRYVGQRYFTARFNAGGQPALAAVWLNVIDAARRYNAVT